MIRTLDSTIGRPGEAGDHLEYYADTMRYRFLAVAVVCYLSLDLANPMMPGAFQLVGVSFESVDSSQARSEEMATPATTAFSAPRRVEPEPRAVLRLMGPPLGIPAFRSLGPSQRTALPAESASSVDDD